MKEVIAMHGWSGDKHSWLAWEEYFVSCGWIWKNAERGYGSMEPYQPLWEESTNKNEHNIRTLICHSLGAHLLNQDIVSSSDCIVLLGSFSRFIPSGKDKRLLKAALRQMQEAIGTSKEKSMLNEFLSKAFYPNKVERVFPGPIQNGLSEEGRKRLESDLILLTRTNGLPIGLPQSAKVLVIQGEEDLIVLPSMRDKLLNDLKQHLYMDPYLWSIPEQGHTILEAGLVKRVEDWLKNINEK